MNVSQVLEKIRSNEVPNFILLTGGEERLKETAVLKIVDALNIQMPDLNVSYFDEGADLTQAAECAQMLPFAEKRRCAVLRKTQVLSSAANAEQSKPLQTLSMPPGNVLVIWAQGKADPRKAFVKRVKKEGYIVECSTLTQNERIQHIVDRARENGLIVSRANAVLIDAESNEDLMNIDSELDKLIAVCHGEITKEDIERYGFHSAEYNIFRIHDLMIARKYAQAFSILEKVLEQDSQPIGFLGLLTGYFRRMLAARACRDAGYSQDKTVRALMNAMGVKSYAAQRAYSQCIALTADQLRKAMKRLAKTDFDAKQGNIVLKTDLYALLADLYGVE